MEYKYLAFLFLIHLNSLAQKTENVILITLDGFRWQEVFSGADSVLLFDEKYTNSIPKASEKFWRNDAQKRRQTLMPFLWSTLKREGLIAGNRALGSKVDVKNNRGFSYPGYNEILTGYPDRKIRSNNKKNNDNINVLEFLNKKPGFDDKVAAFTTWDVFPYIINTERNHIYVSTPLPTFLASNDHSKPPYDELVHNEIPSNDAITFTNAFKYLKEEKPKLLFLSFDATDEFAHEGNYFNYLKAANTIDNYIKEIWEYCQKDPHYRNKTSIIITTDHGRGDVKKRQWTSHGFGVRGCRSIWLAAIGPDIPARHELSEVHQMHQNQIAATISNLFGYTFQNGHKIGKALDLIVE
jgi:hypothetical protein